MGYDNGLRLEGNIAYSSQDQIVSPADEVSQHYASGGNGSSPGAKARAFERMNRTTGPAEYRGPSLKAVQRIPSVMSKADQQVKALGPSPSRLSPANKSLGFDKQLGNDTVGSDESLDLRQSLCGSGQESEEAEWDQIQLDQISGGGSEEEERTGLVERLEQLAKEFNQKRFQQVYQRRRYKKKNDEGKADGKMEIQKGFDGGSSSSSKVQSCGRSGKGIEKDMGPSRVMVERELEKLKKGKMPVLDHKKEMELTKLGKFFGASMKENQKQLQGLIERTLKEGLMAMEEEKLEHMEKIQALETDSEDWEEDEEEEEIGREEGLGGIEEATYRAEASGKARDLKGKEKISYP